MADVLMIAGKPETIFKARDFEYLVEKHMGYEAAKYFREYAEKADEEVRSAKAGENTDLASYEADLESNHRAFQDIQTEAAVITGVLQEKRINREKIAHGDSFHQTFTEEGMAMSRIRLGDKLARFKSLTKSGVQEVKDESIRDTLIDLANYAIMTVLELDDLKAEEHADER